MKTLVLPVKRKWFDLIKSGEKKFEYRRRTEHWIKRLSGGPDRYEKIAITLGYPSLDDTSRRIEFDYHGYVEADVVSEEFGPDPVRVFKIPLFRNEEKSASNAERRP